MCHSHMPLACTTPSKTAIYSLIVERRHTQACIWHALRRPRWWFMLQRYTRMRLGTHACISSC